jgi:hypothetical protein
MILFPAPIAGYYALLSVFADLVDFPSSIGDGRVSLI